MLPAFVFLIIEFHSALFPNKFGEDDSRSDSSGHEYGISYPANEELTLKTMKKYFSVMHEHLGYPNPRLAGRSGVAFYHSSLNEIFRDNKDLQQGIPYSEQRFIDQDPVIYVLKTSLQHSLNVPLREFVIPYFQRRLTNEKFDAFQHYLENLVYNYDMRVIHSNLIKLKYARDQIISILNDFILLFSNSGFQFIDNIINIVITKYGGGTDKSFNLYWKNVHECTDNLKEYKNTRVGKLEYKSDELEMDMLNSFIPKNIKCLMIPDVFNRKSNSRIVVIKHVLQFSLDNFLELWFNVCNGFIDSQNCQFLRGRVEYFVTNDQLLNPLYHYHYILFRLLSIIPLMEISLENKNPHQSLDRLFRDDLFKIFVDAGGITNALYIMPLDSKY